VPGALDFVAEMCAKHGDVRMWILPAMSNALERCLPGALISAGEAGYPGLRQSGGGCNRYLA